MKPVKNTYDDILNAIDVEFAAGDNSKVNDLLTSSHPATMIMTDYSIQLANYLASMGRR